MKTEVTNMSKTMPAPLKEQKKRKVKELIRYFMLVNGESSVTDIHEYITKEQDIEVSYKTVLRYYNEMTEHEVEELRRDKVLPEVAKAEVIGDELLKHMISIVQDENASKGNRIAAARAMMYIQREVLDMKFDAGIFEKQLGDLDINHEIIERFEQVEGETIQERIAGVLRENGLADSGQIPMVDEGHLEDGEGE